MDRDRLRAEQQLARPRAERLGALENAAQTDVDEMIDEQRRHRDVRLEEQPEIAVLDRARGDEAVAEGKHRRVVLARVGIGERREPRGGHRRPRRRHELGVQRALVRARLGDRPQLGPREIAAQEVVGDRELAVGAPRKQVIAGVAPEIGHRPHYIGLGARFGEPRRRRGDAGRRATAVP